MSNPIDNDIKEIKPAEADVEDIDTSNLRGTELPLKTAPTLDSRPGLAKPVLHTNNTEKPLTAADVVEIAEKLRADLEARIKEASYDPNKDAQTIDRAKVAITDFSNLTMDDVYDLSVPIEAKPFMSADVLSIKLKDTNYEARWVNKNPQNLGDKIAKGFTYITPQDLQQGTVEAIKTSLDASGHYSFNDVVAMKIDKATYYRALRAAHERAVATTNVATARKRAAEQANGYMNKSDFSSDYQAARSQRKMDFYDPGVGV